MDTIFTIGFTKRTAEDFFETLKKSKARHLLDVRLSNTSQLAGFTKKQDMAYFLKSLSGMQYHEVKNLAPTEDMFRDYHRDKDWGRLENTYRQLLKERNAKHYIPEAWLKEGVVLLCSEREPGHCHRRLAAEYLSREYSEKYAIVHL